MIDGSIDRATERRAFVVIASLSFVILGYLFWLLYFRAGSGEPPPWTRHLPALNAALNFSSALFLTAGFIAIRKGRKELHMKLMLTAVVIAALFLASYVVYHHYLGDTRFTGQGWIRPVYFFILVSHILLSIAAVPLILTTLFFAASRRFDRHRRLARYTFPVWLYVSVTGVLVFVLLSRFG